MNKPAQAATPVSPISETIQRLTDEQVRTQSLVSALVNRLDALCGQNVQATPPTQTAQMPTGSTPPSACPFDDVLCGRVQHQADINVALTDFLNRLRF